MAKSFPASPRRGGVTEWIPALPPFALLQRQAGMTRGWVASERQKPAYSNTIAGVALSDCSALRRSHTFAAMSR
jgi:hypothetical protein